MLLNKKTQYGAILIREALNASPNPVRLAHVASLHGLSVQFLEQVSSKLTRAGLVRVKRGPNGGIVENGPVTLYSLNRALNPSKPSHAPYLNDSIESKLSEIYL